jgi:VWFA-related protein
MRAGPHRHFVIAVVACVAAGTIAFGQEPAAPAPPQFRAGVTLVPLDVRVLDKKGRPVTGLTQADFTVTENRVPQQIRHFSIEALTPAATPADAPLPRRTGQPTTTLSPQTYRVFLVYLGRGDLTGPADGVDGIVHLVKDRLLPQDRIAVMAWNRATDFSTDHQNVLAVLDRFKRQYRKVDRMLQDYFSSPAYVYGSRGIPENIQHEVDAVFEGPDHAPMRTISASQTGSAQEERDIRETYDLFNAPDSDAVSRERREQLDMSLEDFFGATAQWQSDKANLYAGIEYLRHFEGEKHLVWLTETGLQLPRWEYERDLGRSAADARVALDIIRTGGTVNVMLYSAENRQARPFNGRAMARSLDNAATARTLAGMTGGRSDANRFASASVSADYIDQASRYQYLLGYYPTNPRLDGRFRAIDVTVNRPDVTVLVRRGYYARNDILFDRREFLTFTRLSAAAEDAREIPDLRIAASASASETGAVAVQMSVDPSRLTFQASGGRNTATLDVSVFCLDARQRAVGDLHRTLQLTYSDDRLAEVRKSGIPVTLSVPVRAPAQDLKLVVYDYADDLTGSRNVKIGSATR